MADYRIVAPDEEIDISSGRERLIVLKKAPPASVALPFVAPDYASGRALGFAAGQMAAELDKRQADAEAQFKRLGMNINSAEEELRLIEALKPLIEAWERDGVRLERPLGSAAYRLSQSLASGLTMVLEESEVDDLNAEYLRIGRQGYVPFVIEHDWAAAFANAQDLSDGDYHLPFENTLFEFRASGHNIAVLMTPEHKAVFIEARKLWMAVKWERARHLFEPHVRAVCIALDAEVAVSETVRASERLNRARERRGRTLLSDYHIIRLAARKCAAPLPEDLEGKSARRVRLHFVRGHWRHFENHRTWIKWHLRGDPDLGFIDKHYRL